MINKRKYRSVFGITLIATVIGIEIFLLKEINSRLKLTCPDPNVPVDFEVFDNTVGTKSGCYIVPNIIHFMRFTSDEVTFLEMICYLAAFENQKPEKIYFHYYSVSTFTGMFCSFL